MPDLGNIKPVPNSPELRWNVAAHRYIAPNGRFVPISTVRAELDLFISATTDAMGATSRSLVAGEISLAQWQSEMMVLTKNANMAGAALESGGWYGMGPSEFGRAGSKIRGEYAFLNNFAIENFARASAIDAGFSEERSVLTPSESCDECISEDKAGWRPIGKVVAIGDRTCLSNCNCYMLYRNIKTKETRAA
jgi:hypothetical protein